MRKGTYTHIVMAALAAAIIGVVFASVALSQHQSKTTTSSIQQQNITNITLGANTVELPANTIIKTISMLIPLCPPPGGTPVFISHIVNSSGFRVYNFTNYTYIIPLKDYVISPGGVGIINYRVFRFNDKVYEKTPNGATHLVINNSEFINVSNYITIFNITHNITKGIALVNTYGHAGLSIGIRPGNQITSPHSNYSVTIIIKISPNAIKNTYFVTINPDICGGFADSFFLTIGNHPYNKSINMTLPP